MAEALEPRDETEARPQVAEGEAARPPDEGEIVRAVADARAYDYGRPTSPLREVERLIRLTEGDARGRTVLESELCELFGSEATEAAKRFACEKLWAIGGDASLPALERLLSNPRTTEMACYALATHPSSRANDALRASLPNLEGRPLAAVVNLLGERQDGVSVAALAGVVDGADPEPAAAAVAALGKIATEGALEVLRRVAKGPAPALSREACHALLRAAAELASRGKTEAASRIRAELEAVDVPEAVRRALRARARSGSPARREPTSRPRASSSS